MEFTYTPAPVKVKINWSRRWLTWVEFRNARICMGMGMNWKQMQKCLRCKHVFEDHDRMYLCSWTKNGTAQRNRAICVNCAADFDAEQEPTNA